MAEPRPDIGTIGALGDLVDAIGKSVKTLRDLRQNRSEADLTLFCLESELGILRNALARIEDWLRDDVSMHMHQLLELDLDSCMRCCRLLMSKIDGELSNLDHLRDGSGKAQFAFGGKLGVAEMQRVTRGQIAAVTSLCTVCNCKSTAERKLLLEEPRTRQILQKSEDETASLVGYQDESSIHDRHEDNFSTFLESFDHDTERYVSREHTYWNRASIRRADERQLGPTHEGPEILDSNQAAIGTFGGENIFPKASVTDHQECPSSGLGEASSNEVGRDHGRLPTFRSLRDDAKAKRRSQAIDRKLKQDSKRSHDEVKVLLLGAGKSGTEDILKHMKLVYGGGYSPEEREAYRLHIHGDILSSAISILDTLKELEIPLEMEDDEMHYAYLKGYQLGSGPESRLDVKAGQAIASMWNDPSIRELMEQQTKSFITDPAQYFFDDVSRITTPEYLPTDQDISKIKLKSKGLQEACLQMDDSTITIYDAGTQGLACEKWMHHFENIDMIVFVVNLAEYDQLCLADSTQSQLIESLFLFDSIVNSRWFQNTSIVLLLSQAGLFREKLKHAPLSDYFPDYTGGEDVGRAAKYVLWRFNELNRGRVKVYPHLTSTSSEEKAIAQVVYDAINETITCNNLPDTRALLPLQPL